MVYLSIYKTIWTNIITVVQIKNNLHDFFLKAIQRLKNIRNYYCIDHFHAKQLSVKTYEPSFTLV